MLFLYALSFGILLGAASLNILASLDFGLFSWAFWAVALGLLALAWRIKHVLCWGLFLGLGLGYATAVYKAHKILAWELPVHLQSKIVAIEGKVLSTRPLDLELSYLDQQLLAKPIRIRLFADPLPSAFKEPLLVGMEIQGFAKLKAPIALANPGTWDRERHLFLAQVRAVGALKCDASHPCILKSQEASWLGKVRHNLRAFLLDIVALDQVGTMIALLLGESYWINATTWQLWQGTGTAHLLAISGLHVGGLAALVYALVLCFPFQPKGSRRVRALLFSAGAAFIYSLLAGFNISSLRACLMVLVAIAAKLSYKKISSLSVFCVVLILVILIDPLAPMKVGFWLSFSAVFILLLANKHVSASKLKSKLFPQWAIFIGMLPLSIAFFGQVPLLSFFTNLLAIPWVSFLVVPPLLAGAIFSSKTLVLFSASSLKTLSIFLGWCAAQPWTIWDISRPALIVAFSLIVVLVVLLPHFPGKKWVYQLCLPLFFWSPEKPLPGQLSLTILDVGQGLSAIIETAKHRMIVDFGPLYANQQNAADLVILPYLKERGIKSFDLGVLTHGDLDHRGGLAALVAKIPIERLYTSELERVKESNLKNLNSCVAGMHWEWDGVNFAFLSPKAGIVYPKSNDRSCVLRVSIGDESFLIAGDIQKKAEKLLLEDTSSVVKSTVLLVPHHGSRSSSSAAWVRAVDPALAVMNVGCNNSYGLPHPDIVQAYKDQGAAVAFSSVEGAIKINFAKDKPFQVQSYRDLKQHFWQTENRETRCHQMITRGKKSSAHRSE